MPPIARVLIVDDEADVRSDLVELFGRSGYIAHAPVGRGQELITAALDEAQHFRPHVVVVDHRLNGGRGKQGDGLPLTRQLKPARSILYSNYVTTEVYEEAWQVYGVNAVVAKHKGFRKLEEQVLRAAVEVSARARGVQFERPESCSAERVLETLGLRDNGSALPDDLPYDLLAMVFPQQQFLRLAPLKDAAEPAAPVPRGRTVVMRAWYSDRLQPQLVKLAPATKILQEQHNYHEYVQLNIPEGFGAQLNGCEVFHELGVALYSFLGDRSGPLKTLAEAFPDLSPDGVSRLLEHFFLDVWGGLYAKREILDVPLYDAYDSFLHLDRKLAKFAHLPPALALLGLAEPLRNPFAWMAANKHAFFTHPTQAARTHGDLHTNNLMTDLQHTWVLDFERTGWGPLLRDFVELEIDIVTRLIAPERDQPADALALAAALCQSLTGGAPPPLPPALEKGLRLVHELRSLAGQVIGEFDEREYLWGLLCEALLVAAISPEGSLAYQRAVIFAARATACFDQMRH